MSDGKQLDNVQLSSTSSISTSMSVKSRTVHPSGTAYIPTKSDSKVDHVNQFQSLRFTNNQTTPTHSAHDIPIRPGINSYSDVVRSSEKVSVFSTSITKHVDVQRLNKEYKGGKARIHRFHGKKARHMKHYIPVHMEEDHPDTCVIIAGGNDLPEETSPAKIANELIEAGITCKNRGASKVIIGSVLPRSDFYCQIKRAEVNRILKDLCAIHEFVFMNNGNMSLSYVSHDGVHLNSRGSELLLFNLLWYLNR